jgi:hypothetical protein
MPEPSESQPRDGQVWCRRCGIVRRLRLPAWCRHNALDCPAARMVALPLYHPLHDDAVSRETGARRD